MASACASSAIAAVAIASPSSQKNGSILGATKASFLCGRKLRVRNYTAPSGTRSLSVCAVAADPDRPLWFPGSTPPPWLDGSLPGDFGFDPLGLGSDPESLRWNVQSELVHCRWAMLGAAGIFIPELLTKIGILNTPSWYTAGELEYFTDTTTLFVIELILIGWAEGRRWADILKPGSVNTDPIFPNNKLTGTDVGYPGGLWFDPLGWGSAPINMSTSPIKTFTEQGADHLERAHTTGSISMSPELFEQLYLAPHSRVKGDLRQKLGNPTPLALGGFLLCTTPASMALLGWRGSGGFGAGANVGAYFWFGGLLMLLGSIGEWILGNTFPSVLFGLFGGFWFTFGSTIVPDYNAYGLYSKTDVVADGLKEGEFYSTFSFFLISMGILCAVFAVASIRTNVVLFTILVILVPCFGCLSASFFAVASGESAKALTYQHAGAAILFVVSLLGWYIFLSHILLSVDFPYILPLGDLSSRIPGATKVKKDTHSEEEKV